IWQKIEVIIINNLCVYFSSTSSQEILFKVALLECNVLSLSLSLSLSLFVRNRLYGYSISSWCSSTI
ncbi:MAG: hypothetical protein N7Q72_05435, partial [Spiroplasma sp. Tabriz.8]|nr:hypothetical protein [Spiroplasma sp. Tabriz.8]